MKRRNKCFANIRGRAHRTKAKNASFSSLFSSGRANPAKKRIFGHPRRTCVLHESREPYPCHTFRSDAAEIFTPSRRLKATHAQPCNSCRFKACPNTRNHCKVFATPAGASRNHPPTLPPFLLPPNARTSRAASGPVFVCGTHLGSASCVGGTRLLVQFDVEQHKRKAQEEEKMMFPPLP